jgi:flagellar biosynthesis/type III secretory pathway chaperone
MDMKIKMLSEALSDQLKVFEELLALLERETQELANVNIEAMNEINVQKEDVGALIQVHTATLRQVIGETAISLGLPLNSSLGELAAKLKQQGNKEIILQHEQLNKVAERVQQVAALNHEIAERFSETLSQSLDFLTRIISQSSVYGASGGYQQRPTGAVMINMEA